MDLSKIRLPKHTLEFIEKWERAERKGTSSALLRLLSARGLKVSPQDEERIRGAMDVYALEDCVERAVSAATVAEALAPLDDLPPPSQAASPPREASSGKASCRRAASGKASTRAAASSKASPRKASPRATSLRKASVCTASPRKASSGRRAASGKTSSGKGD